MASLNMVGPYLLTEHEINANVEFGRIGNYAFGYLNDKGVFIVRYVGRSDTNLHTKIMLGLIDKKKILQNIVMNGLNSAMQILL